MDEIDDLDMGDEPPMNTEEGRDQWIEILLSQDEDVEWIDAMIVRNGDDMVARVRYMDGSEEIFDMQIRRSMEVVRIDPSGSN